MSELICKFISALSYLINSLYNDIHILQHGKPKVGIEENMNGKQTDGTGYKLVHLNNSAASLPHEMVYQAMRDYMNCEVTMGVTEAKIEMAGVFSNIYTDIGALVGVPRHRVAIFSSNTEAWQRAFLALNLQPGDLILVGETEWGGNLSMLQHCCNQCGARLDIIPSTESGTIDVAAFANMLEENVRMVCVTWAPATSGGINPVHEIASILKGHQAWYFIDAAQSFGQVSVDLSNPRFDVVSVSTRKFLRSPRGVGFGIFSERFMENVPPLSVDQFSGAWGPEGISILKGARKYEYVEMSYAVRMGLAKAVCLGLSTDWPAVQIKITELATRLQSGLMGIPGLSLQDRCENLSGIVCFSNDRVKPAAYLEFLANRNINIAAPGYVYAPLWFGAGRPPIARLSPHSFNTAAEIDLALEAIEECTTENNN
ncbi:MAG: aminotransferase class V-fold PLP-dependent enzyme [Rhizobiaceae bacterium]